MLAASRWCRSRVEGRRTFSTARLGSPGVVSVLAMTTRPPSPTKSRSVKVPPMSMPTRYIVKSFKVSSSKFKVYSFSFAAEAQARNFER